jgi:hypothetical protein
MGKQIYKILELIDLGHFEGKTWRR